MGKSDVCIVQSAWLNEEVSEPGVEKSDLILARFIVVGIAHIRLH